MGEIPKAASGDPSLETVDFAAVKAAYERELDENKGIGREPIKWDLEGLARAAEDAKRQLAKALQHEMAVGLAHVLSGEEGSMEASVNIRNTVADAMLVLAEKVRKGECAPALSEIAKVENVAIATVAKERNYTLEGGEALSAWDREEWQRRKQAIDDYNRRRDEAVAGGMSEDEFDKAEFKRRYPDEA